MKPSAIRIERMLEKIEAALVPPHGFRSLFRAADANAAVLEVDRVPSKRDELHRPQPMTVGEQDHGPVAVGVAVEAGGGDQLGHLAVRQILPRPGLGVAAATGWEFAGDCPINSA